MVSIVGPSKSGKTVLVEKVVGKDLLIPVSGAQIKAEGDLWACVLEWIGGPSEVEDVTGTGSSTTVTGKTGGKAGIPLLAEGRAEIGAAASSSRADSHREVRRPSGLNQVIHEVGDNEYAVLIDDFHYVPRELQTSVAQECKEAVRRGLKLIVASVPHRSDDVIRSNPDLRGRVVSIDLEYWKADDLIRIANLGFPILNLDVQVDVVKKFAAESPPSPNVGAARRGLLAGALRATGLEWLRINRKEGRAPTQAQGDSHEVRRLHLEGPSRHRGEGDGTTNNARSA